MTFAEKYDLLVKIATFFGIIGVPTITGMTIWCVRTCIKFVRTLNYLQAAIKSQIRADLIRDYERFAKQGSLSQVELDEWSNRHDAYENLVGNNEVLKDRAKKILALPIK